jgi:hypothetical protein
MTTRLFRTTRVVLVSIGVVLAATIVASPAGTFAGGGQGSSCADPTPLRYLPKPGTASPAVTDARVLTAIAAYKSQHDTMSPADRALAATGEAASATKMARSRARGVARAANVAHFASRSEAVQACAGTVSAGAATRLGRVAQALAPSAYACAQNVNCDTSLAYIRYLNHQDEGGGGTWCGPATVSMIALTEPGRSYVTQQTARDYINGLQTASNPSRTVEAVGSDDSSVVAALGQYVTGPNLGITNWYVFVAVNGSPTSQQRSDYHARLVDDISNYGYAVAGNTWEVSGANHDHLPGHPTSGGDIFHYIEIGGYDEGAGTDYFADSATGVPGWGAGVPAYSWFDEYKLVTIIGGRGYIW